MRTLQLLVTVALLLSSTAALAQEPSLDERRAKPQSYASPQHFWFEFKIGPYTPGIDGEFGGTATPYKDIMGYNGKGQSLGGGSGLLFSWELEYEIFRRFGTLAVGGALSYFSKSAPAIVDNGSSAANDPTAARSGSTSTLTLLPLAILAVYRFDWLADRYRIPLVPYAKFGFNYTFWWMLLDGDTRKIYVDIPGTNYQKVLNARGGTFGWQLNLGLAFRLDIIDPSAARALDNEIGINHTYLFFEFCHNAANGFGAAHALGLGDSTWNAGLAFEF
jgi:hypothetical protein